MRLRINEPEHFLEVLEKAEVDIIYLDDHNGFLGTYYHIWFFSRNDCVEIKIKNLDTLLFLINEINNLKKKLRVVRWMNSRRY